MNNQSRNMMAASMGRDAGYRHRAGNRATENSVYSIRRRCHIEEVLHEEERLDGYRVTYEYQGKTYVTRTDEDPGREIEIRISVNPVDYF